MSDELPVCSLSLTHRLIHRCQADHPAPGALGRAAGGRGASVCRRTDPSPLVCVPESRTACGSASGPTRAWLHIHTKLHMSRHAGKEHFPSNASFYIYCCSLVQFTFGSSDLLSQQETGASSRLLLPLLAPFWALKSYIDSSFIKYRTSLSQTILWFS